MHQLRGRAVLAAIAVACLASCIPNRMVKRGDAAAARGEWREAEAAYRQAVDRDPNNVELAKKYGEAKTNAVAFSLRTADACRASNDAACIDRELAYVLRLDPSNVQAASLRTQAREQLATKALEEARLSLESGNPAGAWRQLEVVRSYGVPQGKEEEVTRLDQDSATKADDLARTLLERAKAQGSGDAVSTLAQAHELAAAAAARNTRFGATLAEIDEARRRAIAAEVAAQVKFGDDALARQDYDGAARAYATAYRASGDARFQNRSTYAGSMSAARTAVAQRAFDSAATSLRTAIGTQEDRGAARAMLDAVEPRVYRIRLESLAITATKPGTNSPWVGKPWWKEAAPAVAAAVASWSAGPAGAAAGKAAYDVTNALTSIPPENRPGLVTFIDLPDGRRVKTQTVKGIYVIYGAEFYVYANKLDTRTVRLAVFHDRSGGNESVAVANVPLGQIVSGTIDATAIQGEAQALQQVVFAVDPAEPWQDGGLTSLEVQDQKENRASARSTPTRAASRVQLLSASLVMPTEGGDGDGSNPDPYFEIFQGAKQIVKSTTAQDTRSADWSYAMTDLFLDQNDELTVKLTDADFASDDQIATWTVAPREFLNGQVQLTTAHGTSFALRTAVRADRPR